MKMCSRVLIAVFCVVAWTGAAAAQHTYSKAVQKAWPRITRRIVASMGLKPRPFAFAWNAQGKD